MEPEWVAAYSGDETGHHEACHTPSLTTGLSTAVAALNQQQANLFSDLAVHHSDLLEAIRDHDSNGSEASGVIEAFRGLKSSQKQDILNFLRSL
ncbi:MAG TPA: hypothetical protein VK335_16715 [Bryobacteraceae bacterium]|nr:hypothetical protein [Bryobacteraceae bacterium]